VFILSGLKRPGRAIFNPGDTDIGNKKVKGKLRENSGKIAWEITGK